MRDPTTRVDAEVEAAIEETRIVLGLLSRFGGLRDGVEDDPDADMRSKARIDLTINSVRAEWAQRLPDDVRNYLLRLVSDYEYRPDSEVSHRVKPASPPKRRGRPRNTARDQMLVDMIARIELHGIDRTRNREMRDHRCGCDIVSQVLGELGIDLEEEGVEDVWRRMGHRARLDKLPLVPGLTPDSIDVRD